MATPLANIAARLKAPSQGSLAGDVADAFGGLLAGMQAQEEAAREQAMQEALLELQVRGVEAEERRGDISERQVGATEENVRLREEELRNRRNQEEVDRRLAQDALDRALEAEEASREALEGRLEDHGVTVPPGVPSETLEALLLDERQRATTRDTLAAEQRSNDRLLLSSLNTEINFLDRNIGEARKAFNAFLEEPRHASALLQDPNALGALFEQFKARDPASASFIEREGAGELTDLHSQLSQLNTRLLGGSGEERLTGDGDEEFVPFEQRPISQQMETRALLDESVQRALTATSPELKSEIAETLMRSADQGLPVEDALIKAGVTFADLTKPPVPQPFVLTPTPPTEDSLVNPMVAPPAQDAVPDTNQMILSRLQQAGSGGAALEAARGALNAGMSRDVALSMIPARFRSFVMARLQKRIGN